MNLDVSIGIVTAVRAGDWEAAKALVDQQLAAIGSARAEDIDKRPPATRTFSSRDMNIRDNLAFCRNRYTIYREHDPIHGSLHRSAYRRGLLGLWNTLDHYQKEAQR